MRFPDKTASEDAHYTGENSKFRKAVVHQDAQVQRTPASPTGTGDAVLPTEVATIEFAGYINEFLLDMSNNRIYLTDQSGVLSVVDATSYQVLATLPFVGKLTLDPHYPRLYVTPSYRAFDKPAAIQVIDTATLTVTATIPNATDLALDLEHDRIFVGNALHRPAPPNPSIGGLRVLDAATLETQVEAPLDGIPIYNPVRDELLLVAYSLFRVDPATLAIRQDLFPAMTAEPCKDCMGVEQIAGVQVLAAQNLLALDLQIRSTPTAGRLLPPFRFLDATTLLAIPPAAAPVVQPTCNRQARVQPMLDNRIYRHQAYAGTFLFHNWRIETPAGKLLRTVEGLAAPFINPNTRQAYTNNWVLALPALRPVGLMPTLTCIFDHDWARGLIYAQRQKELVVLNESGNPQPIAPPSTPLGQLPVAPVTQIALPANFEQTKTLFVTQYNTLYRSIDAGGHWELLTSLPLNTVTGLQVALSPAFAQDETLFVGGGDGIGSAESAGGVFRSVDGGASWQSAWQGLQHLRISDVAISPNFVNDQTLLAYANYMQFDPIDDGKSIHRSTDGGLSWSLWVTMTDGPLPPGEALLPAPTPPPVLPIRLNQYRDKLLRSSNQDATEEAIDLYSTLGSPARAMLAAPDFAESGVVYVMGERALWRIREAGAVIEAWGDPRLAERKASSEPLTALTISPLYNDSSHRLVIGTGGGELWILNPAELAWQAPLTVTATPLTPPQAGVVSQPLLAYTVAQSATVQLVLRTMDGSQHRAVTLPPNVDENRVYSVSPDGGWLAYYTGAVSRPNQQAGDDLTLHLLNVASGEAMTIAALLPPDFPDNLTVNARWIGRRIPEVADDPQLTEGIWWGFADALTIHAWSPDGQQLAFAGAMDGPSSDLYLYNLDNRTLTRLTDGPEQITAIRWSPDGKWIWHSSISIGFCQSCYGHKYAAAADGSQIITIPGDESDRFIAWLGPDRYLESEQANGIGDFHLYEVNLIGQPVREFWTGSYNAFILNRDQQRMVIEGAPTPSIYPADVGLYEVDLTTGKFITTSLAYLLKDVANRLTHRPLLPCPFGTTLIVHPCDPIATSPFSPDGRWWVDPDLTLHTIDGRLILPSAIRQKASSLFWRRDSEGFYFLVDGDLYYRPLLDSWPVLIEQGVSGLAWVE